jgi:hypothetical protein
VYIIWEPPKNGSFIGLVALFGPTPPPISEAPLPTFTQRGGRRGKSPAAGGTRQALSPLAAVRHARDGPRLDVARVACGADACVRSACAYTDICTLTAGAAGVYAAFVLVLAGVAGWEFVLWLPFDARLLFVRRKFRWPMVRAVTALLLPQRRI